MKYACPCCGYRTFDEQVRGSHSICPVCFWEDDDLQCELPDDSGANIPLRKAQKNFILYGATTEDMVQYVVKDRSTFEYEGPLDLTAYRPVHIEEMAKIFLALDINFEKLLELYTMRHISKMKLEFMLEELFPYMEEQEMYDYYALKVNFDLVSERTSLANKSEVEQQERYREIVEHFKSKLMEALACSE